MNKLKLDSRKKINKYYLMYSIQKYGDNSLFFIFGRYTFTWSRKGYLNNSDLTMLLLIFF